MYSAMTNSEKSSLLVLSVAAGASMSLLFNCLIRIHYFTLMTTDQTSVYQKASEDWVRSLLIFLTMLSGMFFNQVFNILMIRKRSGYIRVNPAKLFLQALKRINFWIAISVSPIIFYVTFYLANAIPDNSAAYFYAFQHGFFWYSIFKGFDKQKETGIVD